MAAPTTDGSTPGATPRWPAVAALALLLVGAGLHLAYLAWNCPIDLSGDEAHYWEWSRHLDISYYSKGPLVAYIIAGGRALLGPWSERVVGSEMLAVRGPAILLSVLTGWGIYVLGVLVLRNRRVALGAVALTCTVPIFAVGAMLMTIDAPLACCYVWTLVCVAYASRSGRGWPWIVAGVLIAVGVLAKYTMFLVFPPVGLALLTERPLRSWLRRPWPYAATVLGFAGLLPILIWNMQHDWVSFRHVAGQAGVREAHSVNPIGPLEMLAGQLAVVGPVWFIALLFAAVQRVRRNAPVAEERFDPALMRLLVYATWTPWVVFGAFSFITKVQPNWPVLALLPGVLVLAQWLATGWRHAREKLGGGRAWTISGAATGALLVLVMHNVAWLTPVFVMLARNAPPWEPTPLAKYDPTARLRGWGELGAAVGRVRDEMRAAGETPFIVTDDYQVASAVAFYTPGEPDVYCLQAVLGDRQSQYDMWPNPIRNPEAFAGRPCIYIGARKPELFGEQGYPPAFAAPELRETVTCKTGGYALQLWTIYTSRAFLGVPEVLLQRIGEHY